MAQQLHLVLDEGLAPSTAPGRGSQKRSYKKPLLRKNWTDEWVGLITVLSWALFVGFFVAVECARRGTELAFDHRDDVIETLRRLPTSR